MTQSELPGTDRQTPGIDVPRVTAWLTAHSALEGVMTFTRIGSGQSNLSYRIDDAAGASAVLRRGPLGEVLESAHDMAREYSVIDRLHRVHMPVPATVALCEDAAVTGAPFYVMGHVEGTIITSPEVADTLSPEARHTSGLALADTLARLQSVDLEAVGFGDMLRPRAYLDRQLRRWRGQWEASRTCELPLVNELSDRLAGAMPEETETVLVHGDYRIDNAVLDDAGRIIAVLDWELSTVGHPLADVGLMLAYMEEARLPEGLFQVAFLSPEGFATAAEIAERYGEATGRSIADVEYFIAFAYWKIAIICEGVYRRWLNDSANGTDRAGAIGGHVERLVTLADDRARRVGI